MVLRAATRVCSVDQGLSDNPFEENFDAHKPKLQKYSVGHHKDFSVVTEA